ncbi:hypothetical protein AWC18_05205 [Mycolicibacter nonchromogenicus]|uniref:Hemophore-related protein n=1 Tax=Mycolicibacter nonchromogenicus TaxID=1782 RepID=A0A1X1ZIH6_MYCNO|nr:hemophore-related protein [Mycolicibacter nonchromogenicus]ORW23138.1 hypothetical protein AWC18_05205 [Mycolicibacter nonchromogenicus]
MSELMRLAGGGGIIVLTLTVGRLAAAAGPDTGPVVNTTCSYAQVVSAMIDRSPDEAERFNATPAARSWLQNFLAAPPEQRQQIVDAAQDTVDGAHYVALFVPLADHCDNYYNNYY